MKKLLAMFLCLLLLPIGNAHAAELGRYKRMPSCIIAEDFTDLHSMKKRGWNVVGTPQISSDSGGRYVDLKDARNDYISFQNSISLAEGTAIIEVKFDDISGEEWEGIMTESPTSGAGYHLFAYGDGKIAFFNNNHKSGVLENDTWYQVAITWDSGGTNYSYIDGVEVGSKDGIGLEFIELCLGRYNSSSHDLDGEFRKLLLFNRQLSELEIGQIYNNTVFDYNDDHLIHWWKMDQLEIADQVGDAPYYSSNGLTRDREVDGGIYFDGGSDQIRVGETSTLLTNLTVAAKIQRYGEDSHDTMFMSRVAATSNAFQFRIKSASNALCVVRANIAEEANGTIEIGDRAVAHCVATYDYDTDAISLYVNGVHDVTASADEKFVHEYYYTIGERTAGSEEFKGIIYDMKIYDTPLTNLQIEDLYIREGRQ